MNVSPGKSELANDFTPRRLRQSHFFRVISIGLLVAILQIPIAMISGVMDERERRRGEAVEEVTSKWGRRQEIIGPLLVLPYHKRVSETEKDGAVRTRTELHHAVFLPSDLRITGKVACETRYRGIYEVPVYTAGLELSGSFPRPDPSGWGVAPGDILWDRAHLTLRVSDTKAIATGISLKWGDQDADFLPGSGEFGGDSPGIHAPLKGRLSGDVFPFTCRIGMNGSDGLFFAPVGRETSVALSADWANPSFQGGWLPVKREIGPTGFQAEWLVSFLGRDYPQQWRSGSIRDNVISESLFGVRFPSAVDHYRMSERSIKYEILFLVLTFTALWLFEVLTSVRLHALQYILVGAALCVFYLLELSLAEHIGFTVAYLVATLAITGLIHSYCAAILGKHARAAVMGLVMALLYGYLYILLMNQDYALLIGSVCLFGILALIMYLTRKVDWHSSEEAKTKAPDAVSGDEKN